MTEGVSCEREREAEDEAASYFREREDVLVAIASVCAGGGQAEGGWDEAGFVKSFEFLTLTLGKYQEQPTLLSSSLGEMVEPLTQQLVNILELAQNADGAPSDDKAATPQLHAVCKVLQLISRVRGFKHVVKLFPHEVSNLEPCLLLLRGQDRRDYSNWETRYVFLTWLCMLCLIPFDICSMDSMLTSNTLTEDAVDGAGQELHVKSSSLVRYIVELCKTYLSDPGPTREAASACLSALLTRPDMETELLSEFLTSSCKSMQTWARKGSEASQELTGDSFNIIGVLHCVAQIFKKGHRSRLLAHAPAVLTPCLLIAAQNNQTLTRKLVCKLAQRIGMTFLPPRIASWRYQRGQRSLLQNLQQSEVPDVSKSSLPLSPPTKDEDGDDDDFETPDELEDIIDLLLTSLQDKDTIVRWNAAKGVGRITMRLTKELADDIVGAVIELFEDGDSDSAWHGGCLALAELTRRGLLLPDRLAEVVPIVQAAIRYDVLRGQHSVGAHVRDAACYVCWAFARAYSPIVMRPFIAELTAAMLITALYDREINCRRAASAAFQENVGRQGNENFPFGIEIITIADYFSLGNRTHAFLHIAPSVAVLAEHFHESLATHLLEHVVSHWDENMRALGSQALARLAKIHPQKGKALLKSLLSSSTSPSIAVRHGSVLAISEVVLELIAQGTDISTELNDEIVDLVLKLDKARLYRGRGGEILRHASCMLLDNIARSRLSMDIKKKVSLVEFLNENLRQPHEFIQKAASAALRQFLFSYLSSGDADPSERLQKLTVLKYMQGLATEENVAATRGYALALGILPAKLATQPAGRLAEILSTLATSSSPQKLIAGEADAETRRNSVLSAIEVVERLAGSVHFTNDCLQSCLGILFAACQDYSIDKRGDTGSWSRIAALEGLERIVYACVQTHQAAESGNVFVQTGFGPANVDSSIAAAAASAAVAFVRVRFPLRSLGYLVASERSATTDDKATASTLVHHPDVVVISKNLSGEVESSTSFIDATTFGRIICAFLEQMAGRLDAVRDVAGNCLHRLVVEGLGPSRCNTWIPDSATILSALASSKAALSAQANSDSVVNWANPAHVFSFLALLLESTEYFHSIISGFVIAVGGLTESVVKESEAALLDFCRSKIKANQTASLLQLIKSLVDIFDSSENNDRVILPLLKTLDKLLRNGVFEPLMSGNSPELALKLLESIKNESKTSTNVIKIKACIDILAHLLQFEDPIRPDALKSLVIFLGHKYPRVRKHSAELLYVQFLSDSHSVGPSIDQVAYSQQLKDDPSSPRVARCGLVRNAGDLEKAQEILTTTPWDGPMPRAREQRLLLCTLLDLKVQIRAPSEEGTSGGAAKRVKQTKDELDSYESLVRSAGY